MMGRLHRRIAACGLIACAGVAHGASTAWSTQQGNGNFSATAQNVCSGTPAGMRERIVWSPDGRRKIVTGNPGQPGSATMVVDESGHPFALALAAWPCPEVAWAPDSHAFFVTYSDGGAVGTYDVAAYRLAHGQLQRMMPGTAAHRDFSRHYPRCDTPETPNVAGVAWSADGDRLLLAAQVLPHSNCDAMGTFALYEVALPSGRILARHRGPASHAAFKGLLGKSLQSERKQDDDEK